MMKFEVFLLVLRVQPILMNIKNPKDDIRMIDSVST